MAQTADQCKILGNDCMKNQDFSGAVKNYSLGLKLDPENPILHCNMAQAYLNMKKYVEAEKCAKKAIEHRSDYVKAYYRAAKGALGRHNVYDSMMCLAQGVQNCLSQDVEELFLMAKDLSPEFENALRSFREKEKSQASAKGKTNTSKKGSKSQKAVATENVCESKLLNVKAVGEEKDKLQAEVNDMRENRKKLDKEEELLKQQLKEIEAKKKQELEKEDKKVKELEEKKKEKREQELKEKEKERISEELREKERKDQEKKAQEVKEQEKRALERRNRERKQLELKEREKKEKEKKAEEDRRLAKFKAQELERLKKELQGQMKEGSLALLKGLHRKAIDSFNKAFDFINSNPSKESLGVGDPKDIVVLQFAFSQARIYSTEYLDIVKAIQQLDKMVEEKWHIELPAIFLLLGNAYIRLNRFSHAIEPLNRGISYLSKDKLFPVFSWPGTNDVIQLTDRKNLRDALESSIQTCKQYHKPDAVCFYENCLRSNQHILPSRHIYFSDPDFVGFIHIICQESCHIYFHLSCWKDYKENLSEIQKLNEKDFLGKKCLTPDCVIQNNNKPSVVIKVIIVGPDGEEKSSCEYTPPPPSPPVVMKEKENVDKSPKKKPRKKLVNTVTSCKRTRKDSRSLCVAEKSNPQENGQGYKDALAKLAAVRQSNFGYGAEAPNPHKVIRISLPSKLGKDEEFVYSYFLEIFKKEGYMSIYKLQEHWETNKELLPILKPALITHTDLVKFLLDTNGFAVVQDMIGITSELPNISAIVEAKVEVPMLTDIGWTPSAATVLETSKTLSYTTTMNDRTVNDPIANDPIANDPIANDSITNDPITNDPITNDPITNDSTMKGPDANDLTMNDPMEIQENGYEMEASTSNVSGEKSYLSHCSVEDTHLDRDIEVCPDVHSSASSSSVQNSIINIAEKTSLNPQDFKSGISIVNNDSNEIKELSANVGYEANINEQQGEQININTVESKDECHETCEQATVEVQKQELSSQNLGDFYSSSVNFSPNVQQTQIQTKALVDSKTGQSSSSELMHRNENPNPSLPENGATGISRDVIQTDIKTQPRSAWKPRAKLLEWASETFPGYSRSRLWEALTLVRAQNNYTLSGLSFTLIEERVRAVLQEEDNF